MRSCDTCYGCVGGRSTVAAVATAFAKTAPWAAYMHDNVHAVRSVLLPAKAMHNHVQLMEQRSPEWRKARLGIPTASNFDRIVTKSGTPSDQRQGYMARLICERIFKRPMEEPVDNKWIRHGIAYEDEAAREFENRAGLSVKTCGFITSVNNEWGASPDRLVVGNNAAVEIKCPAPWTHVDYVLHGPGKNYKPQVQGQMLVGGYEAVYFFSYFPGMPSAFVPVLRDETFITTLRTALQSFCESLDKGEKEIRKLYKTNNFNYDMALNVIAELMPEWEG